MHDHTEKESTMARTPIIQITDNLTGEALNESEAVYVKLTVEADGEKSQTVLDLSKENYAALVEALAVYFDKGNTSSGKSTVTTAGATSDPDRNSKIRAWRNKLPADYVWNGEEVPSVSERGRIPAAVVKAYEAIEEGNGAADDTTKGK